MMKTLSKALVMFLLLGMGAAHANAKGLETPTEVVQYRTLKNLQWAPTIDEKQRDFAIAALDADNFLVVNEAIKAILVHHVAAAGERLQAVADRNKYYSTNRFAGMAARLLQEPAARMRPALHDLWTRMPKEPYNPNICDRHDLPEDMVYDTLAILEAKALRADAQAQRFIGQTELDWYRAHRWKYPFLVALFKYSLLPEDQALEGILAALSHVQGGNNVYYEGYALLEVLGTYDQTAANAKKVATLMADATLADSTPDGRRLLIDALDWRHLRREQAQRLYARFSDARAQAAYFPSQPKEATAFLAKLQKALGENAVNAKERQILPIDVNWQIEDADAVISARLVKAPLPYEVLGKVFYRFEGVEILAGDFAKNSYLVLIFNVNSTEGTPVKIEKDVRYLMFLKKKDLSKEGLPSTDAAYSLLRNWKGFLPLSPNSAEKRFHLYLQDQGIDTTSAPLVCEAIKAAASGALGTGKEGEELPQAVRDVAQKLDLHNHQKPSPEDANARAFHDGLIKGGGKLTAADLVLPYEQKADGLVLIADTSLDKYRAYEPWKHQGTKEEKELFAQALKACQDVIDQYPKTDQAARMHFNIRGLYHTRGDDKEAHRVLEVISREYAGSPYADRAYVALGRNEAKGKRYDKAMEYLAKVPPESEYHCSAQIEIAKCLLDMGKKEEAKRLVMNLLTQRPNRKSEYHYLTLVKIAECLLNMGENEESKRLVMDLLTRHPNRKDELRAEFEKFFPEIWHALDNQ